MQIFRGKSVRKMGFYGNMGQMWAIERNKLPYMVNTFWEMRDVAHEYADGLSK